MDCGSRITLAGTAQPESCLKSKPTGICREVISHCGKIINVPPTQTTIQRASLLRKLAAPLFLLLILGTFYLLGLAGTIPPPQELSQKLGELFLIYGIPLVVVCSFLENLAGANSYFPGAFTILTAMAVTAGHPAQAVATYFAIYLPAVTANYLSFWLGTLTRPESNAEKGSNRKLFIWVAATYWHPQLASLTAYSMGAKRLLSFRAFALLSLPVSFVWSVFWATIIYFFGVLTDFTGYLFVLFLLYAVGWLAFELFGWLRTRRNARMIE